MRKVERVISVKILTYGELTEIEKALINCACKIRLNAQAPYSHYQVGCALITARGEISTGCNVERVSWTQTDHAEQVAVSSVIARFGTIRIAGMAIVGGPEEQKVVWPPPKRIKNKILSSIKAVGDVCPSCGQCLQIIAENCFDEKGEFDPSVPLLGYRYRTGEIYRTTIGDAYPMPFLPQHLGINYAEIREREEK